jgi:hypothetical protein
MQRYIAMHKILVVICEPKKTKVDIYKISERIKIK